MVYLREKFSVYDIITVRIPADSSPFGRGCIFVVVCGSVSDELNTTTDNRLKELQKRHLQQHPGNSINSCWSFIICCTTWAEIHKQSCKHHNHNHNACIGQNKYRMNLLYVGCGQPPCCKLFHYGNGRLQPFKHPHFINLWHLKTCVLSCSSKFAFMIIERVFVASLSTFLLMNQPLLYVTVETFGKETRLRKYCMGVEDELCGSFLFIPTGGETKNKGGETTRLKAKPQGGSAS